MPLTKGQQARLEARFNELFREVGTLLIAFAPLDYFLQEHVDVTVLGFGIIGLALVTFSVLRELRGVQ